MFFTEYNKNLVLFIMIEDDYDLFEAPCNDVWIVFQLWKHPGCCCFLYIFSFCLDKKKNIVWFDWLLEWFLTVYIKFSLVLLHCPIHVSIVLDLSQNRWLLFCLLWLFRFQYLAICMLDRFVWLDTIRALLIACSIWEIYSVDSLMRMDTLLWQIHHWSLITIHFWQQSKHQKAASTCSVSTGEIHPPTQQNTQKAPV